MTSRCRYKDLCLDVVDVPAMAAFWSAVLGLQAKAPAGTAMSLSDGNDTHTLWLNPVPEAKAVKHRVHLDVHTARVEDLLDLGARVVDGTQPWTVLVDPEGGEFCAFVRPAEELPRYRLYEVVVDVPDPEPIAAWWAGQLGVSVERAEDQTFCWLTPGAGLPWEIVFAAVPEPKAAKNRVHWDLWGDTEELLAAGATLLRLHEGKRTWDVLADPVGNEFCVFSDPAGTQPVVPS